ncbi:MAG: hypothetical protein ABI995_09995, partial [Acidobacteriota bacterium]
LVLTNWTGTTGFVMALAAYILSKLGARRAGARPIHWPTLIGIGAIAYLIASPWIPPSEIHLIQIASATLEITLTTRQKFYTLIPFAILLITLHQILKRRQTHPWLRFFIYYMFITGAVVATDKLGLPLIPIGHRFHLEFEIAASGVAAYIAWTLAMRWPQRIQIAAACVAALAVALQARHYRNYADDLDYPIDFTTTAEYKLSKGIAASLNGERVFATGSTSSWMNLYSDTPQFFGCCEQSILADQFRMAIYQIHTGDGAKDRDAEITTMWLKAYGASAVAVQASGTAQFGQPFVNPKKFDGYLKEIWRDGDNVIYRVPRPSPSLAHVINRTSLMYRSPENGIDTKTLSPFIDALDHPASLATMRWLNQHEIEITATTEPNQVIYLQQTYDNGWHAYDNVAELQITRDILNLTVINPGVPGPHKIKMIYSGDEEDGLADIAHYLGIALLLLSTYRARKTAS